MHIITWILNCDTIYTLALSSEEVILHLLAKMLYNSDRVNPDLAKEREKCTFDVEELSRYWIGDQTKLEEKRARG